MNRNQIQVFTWSDDNNDNARFLSSVTSFGMGSVPIMITGQRQKVVIVPSCEGTFEAELLLPTAREGNAFTGVCLSTREGGVWCHFLCGLMFLGERGSVQR